MYIVCIGDTIEHAQSAQIEQNGKFEKGTCNCQSLIHCIFIFLLIYSFNFSSTDYLVQYIVHNMYSLVVGNSLTFLLPLLDDL